MLILSPKQEWFGNIRGDILAGIVVNDHRPFWRSR